MTTKFGICFPFLNSPVNVKRISYFVEYISLCAMLFVFDLKEMKREKKIFLSVHVIFYNLNRRLFIMRIIKIEVSKSEFCLFVEERVTITLCKSGTTRNIKVKRMSCLMFRKPTVTP